MVDRIDGKASFTALLDARNVHGLAFGTSPRRMLDDSIVVILNIAKNQDWMMDIESRISARGW